MRPRRKLVEIRVFFCKSNIWIFFLFFFQHLAEGARIQAQLQSSLTLLSKTKEKYEKAFGASERALDAYQKADADLHLSRAEVEKQRMNSTIKSQQYDDAKNEYANQLQKTNESQVSGGILFFGGIRIAGNKTKQKQFKIWQKIF